MADGGQGRPPKIESKDNRQAVSDTTETQSEEVLFEEEEIEFEGEEFTFEKQEFQAGEEDSGFEQQEFSFDDEEIEFEGEEFEFSGDKLSSSRDGSASITSEQEEDTDQKIRQDQLRDTQDETLGRVGDLFNRTVQGFSTIFTEGLLEGAATASAAVANQFGLDIKAEDIPAPPGLYPSVYFAKQLQQGQTEDYDITSLRDGGRAFGQLIREMFPTNPEYRDDLVSQIATGGGQLAGQAVAAIPAAATATATAPAAVAGSVGVGVLSALQAGQAEFEQAKAEGASDDEAFDVFLLNAGSVGVLESIPFLGKIAQVKRVTGNTIPKALKLGPDSKIFNTIIGAIGKQGAIGGVLEGASEVGQQYVSNTIAGATYDEARNITQGWTEAGIVGFTLGALTRGAIGGLAQAAEKVRTSDEAIAVTEAQKQLEDKKLEAFLTTPQFRAFYGNSVVRDQNNNPKPVFVARQGVSFEAEGQASTAAVIIDSQQGARRRRDNQALNKSAEVLQERRAEIPQGANRQSQVYQQETGQSITAVSPDVLLAQEVEAMKAGKDDLVNAIQAELEYREAEQLQTPQTVEEARRFLAEEQEQGRVEDVGERVVEGYVRIEDPLELGATNVNLEDGSMRNILRFLDAEIKTLTGRGNQSKADELDKIRSEFLDRVLADRQEYQQNDENLENYYRRKFNETLKNNGYDGIRIQGTKTQTQHLIFNTAQFESSPRSVNQLKELRLRNVPLDNLRNTDPKAKTQDYVPLSQDTAYSRIKRRFFNFLQGGSITEDTRGPEALRQEIRALEGRQNAELEQIMQNLNGLANALVNEYNPTDSESTRGAVTGEDTPDGAAISIKRFIDQGFGENVPEQVMVDINHVLNGRLDIDILDTHGVSDNLKQSVLNLRYHANEISRQQIEAGVVQGETALTFQRNIGAWLNRSYRKYQQPDWSKITDEEGIPDKIPDQVWNKAVTYIRRSLYDEGVRGFTIDSNGVKRYRIEDENAPRDRLIKMLEAEDSPALSLLSPEYGSVNQDVLNERNDIAPEIRALFGEISDPFEQYARSLAKTASMVENRKFINRIADLGNGIFFFEEGDPNKPKTFTATVAAESTESKGPLAGMMTHPEIKEALSRDLHTKPEDTFTSMPFIQNIIKINSLGRFGKTILNPMTWVVNNIGGGIMTAAQGTAFGPQIFKEVSRRMRAMSVGAINPEDITYIQRAAELGLDTGGAKSGTVQELTQFVLDNSSETDPAAKRFDGLFQDEAGVAKIFKKLGLSLSEGYQTIDVVYRLGYWEAEKRNLRKAYPNKSEEWIERRAADKVKKTYQDYSQVPKGIQKLSQTPIIGLFISFQSEMLRTTYGTMSVAKQEITSGNTKERNRGIRRLISFFGTAAGSSYVLQGLGTLASGVTGAALEELQEADFIPEWDKNSKLMPVGRDGDTYYYINPTRYNPYAVYGDAAFQTIFRQGLDETENPKEVAGEIASRLSEGFIQLFGGFANPELGTQVINEIANNKKQTGGPVYNPDSDFSDLVGDISSHLFNRAGPGIIGSMTRVYETSTDRDPETKTADELLSLIGFRVTEIDLGDQLQYKGFEVNDALQNNKADARDQIEELSDREFGDFFQQRQDSTSGYADYAASIRSNNQRIKEQWKDIQKSTQIAIDHGLSYSKAIKNLQDAGFSEPDAKRLALGYPIELLYQENKIKPIDEWSEEFDRRLDEQIYD